MSGVAPDPLDWLADWMTSSLNRSPYVEIDREVALALVEIARAARDLLESRLWESGDGSESWQKANHLAATLARLDKGAE